MALSAKTQGNLSSLDQAAGLILMVTVVFSGMRSMATDEVTQITF